MESASSGPTINALYNTILHAIGTPREHFNLIGQNREDPAQSNFLSVNFSAKTSCTDLLLSPLFPPKPARLPQRGKKAKSHNRKTVTTSNKIMSTIGYLIIYIAVAIWVFLDAKKRLINGLPWAICTAIFGPLVVPIYLAKRPLKDGELREGGLAWNVLKNFALFWTLTIFGGGLVGMVGAADAAKGATTDLEKAGAGCGMVMGFGLIASLWFFPMIFALILGFFLKKSSVIEKGPTGPLVSRSQSEGANGQN